MTVEQGFDLFAVSFPVRSYFLASCPVLHEVDGRLEKEDEVGFVNAGDRVRERGAFCLLVGIRAENAIRPFVVGRKNWLFSDSPKGAAASAMIYSLVVSAKQNGLKVEEYLTNLLRADGPIFPY